MIDWSESYVLVTGGAGFIGGLVVEHLLKRGAIVDVIDDMSVGSLSTVPSGVRKVYTAEVNEESIKELNTDYDMVFHFAAPCTVLMFDDDPIKLYMNAITSAYYIRKFCSDSKIPYLVYASSATYYGNKAGRWHENEPLKRNLTFMENMKPTPANIYGATKTAEEDLDTLFSNVRTCALRMFPAYGPREYLKGDVASIQYKMLESIINDEPVEIWGDGDQLRDYIYQEDLAYVIITLAERLKTGAFNIGTGLEHSHNDLWMMSNKICKELEYIDKYKEPKYVENPYEDSYLRSLRSDISKLEREIGTIPFTPMHIGIKKTADAIYEKGILENRLGSLGYLE